MSSVRQLHSSLLKQAISSLEVLNSESPKPEVCIQNALKDSETVWRESSIYMPGHIRKQLRIDIVKLRGIEQAAMRQEYLRKDDLKIVAAIRTELSQIEATLGTAKTDKRREDAHSDFSALGMRFDSLTDLVDAKPFVVASHNLHETKIVSTIKTTASGDASPYDIQSQKQLEQDLQVSKKFEEVQAFKNKLPTKLKSDNYILARMPILATLKSLDSNKLRRSGLDATVLSGGFLFKNPQVMGQRTLRDMPTVLFANQLLLGVSNDLVTGHQAKIRQVEIQQKKKQAGKKTNLDVQDSSLDEIIAAVSQRLGPQIDVLSTTNKVMYIRSPGNPLAWIWLMPERTFSQGFMKVDQAEFPWRSAEQQHVKQANLEKESRELRSLKEQQDVLVKRGMSLKKEDLDRIEQLKQRQTEYKPAETPDEKTKRLAAMKKELQDRINKRFAKELIQINLLKEDIQELEDHDDKSARSKIRDLNKQIEAIEAKIEKAKPDLIQDIKSKYNK